MKHSILSMAIIALLAFSCNKDEVVDMTEQNAGLVKDRSLTQTISKLATNEEFRTFMTSRNLQRNNGDHGVMLLSDGYNLAYGGFIDGLLYLMGGEGSIQAMPNGRARFSIHTNNPSASVLDFADFSSPYSSECVDGPLGTFNYNLISEYEVVVFEFEPGVTFTFYFPTYVNASAETANGHCRVSDAQPMYDETTFEFIGCGEATEFKTIRLNANNGSGITID